MTRITRLAFAAYLALSTLAPSAHAWGNDGHRIVGDIAWSFLEPKAKLIVKDYLTNPRYSTLAEAATWPDTYARRFKKYNSFKTLHYVDISPQEAKYVASRDCPSGCVVTAIDKYLAVLAKSPAGEDDDADWKARQHALYWVAHFVGDIHQPLHVAHPDNNGGGKTYVFFLGQKVKAHWVWDTGLVAKETESFATSSERDDDSVTEALWQDLSFSLESEITPELAKTWRASLSPVDWANESLALAKQQAYLKKDEVVTESYVASRRPALRQQLMKAGVRLAAVLNRALVK